MRSSLILTIHTLIFIFALGVTDSFAYEPSRVIDINDAAFLESVENGEGLFKSNCSSCHGIGKKLIGPDLKDVWTRWESEEDIISWTRNSQAFLKTGNAYANALYKEYGQSPMISYLSLSDKDITDIFDYVRAKQGGVYPIAVEGETSSSEGEPTGSGMSTGVLWLLVACLAVVFVLLWRVSARLEFLRREKEGFIPGPKTFLTSILKKRVIGAISVLAFIVIGYAIGKGAVELGTSQGYMPEQPISFSHALHAGQNQIDCQYCHSGAEKSKHANIPSTSVCMNCHEYVESGPKYASEEIDKIYDYVGWDKSKRQYTKPAEPIKWVKIHNLPDHVYFNHSQHVNVGKLDCKTCHGKVEEMEVV